MTLYGKPSDKVNNSELFLCAGARKKLIYISEIPGGLLRVFYLTSTSDLTPPISVVYLDLDKPSEAGSTFLVVDSLVKTEVKIDGPSVDYKLDLGRPDGKGESRCKLFKGRSSARWTLQMNFSISSDLFPGITRASVLCSAVTTGRTGL